MKHLSTLFFLFASFAGLAQSTETHDFITYDTAISITSCQFCAADKWNVRISRPKNMFVAGNADTASRPCIFSMPGQGELGADDVSKLEVYGPHYWLNHGWDGGVTLGNGKHYPILITSCYINNVYPTGVAYYNLLIYLLNTYHIKRNSVHLAGLSQGAFTSGSLILYEVTAGAETGMKLVTTLTCFEGLPAPLPAPYSTWDRGYTAYKIWAKKYGGRYFYLEGSGSDNFRDGWHYADAMNDTVPGSAYFSYENLGGGAHCCWNSMYDPSATNWTSVGTLGPNNAPSQVGKNSMGDYKAPSSVFQWMLKHGDSSLVGVGKAAPPAAPPVANAGSDQTITLPTSSVTLSGSGSETGGTITGYSWSWISGPSQYSISNAGIASPVISNLITGTYTFQLKVTDAKGTTATDVVNVTVNAAPNSGNPPAAYLTIPGKIEAESYNVMNGIATEPTSDAGGGSDVGWIDAAGDMMSYNINVATAGVYTVNFRVASIYSGAVFQVQNASGAVLANVAVSNTGGWQVWTTASANVTLPAGQQALKLVSSNANGWNINWMQFTLLNAINAKAIPGTIQAEDYDNMSGIATEPTSDAGGGSDVGWIDAAGDMMSYNVNVATAGVYTVNFRVASIYTGAVFQLQNASGTALANVTVSNTGGWQAWTTISANVTLPAGQQALKLVSSNANGWNINWMQFTLLNAINAKTIPGTIQAEDYDNMSGIATEPTSDAGGGSDVGWIDAGDVMSYNVNVATAGAYTVNFRVASQYSGAAFQLQNASGAALANITVSNTGGWQAWTTVSANVTLPAGQQVLKLVSSNANGWNINWLQFVNKTSAGAEAGKGVVTNKAFITTGDGDPTQSAPHFDVYPNPASDQVMLTIVNNHSGPMKALVISTTGVILRTYELNKDLPAIQVPLSVNGLAAGIYIIRVQGADWSETKKILKK